MIKKIFSSIFVGIMVTLLYAQYDPWVHEVCTFYVISYLKQQSANQELGCTVSCQLESINFFTSTLIVKDVVVASPDLPIRENSEWQWKAKKLVLSFSWVDLLKNGCIDLYLCIYGCHIESEVNDGSVAISSYISNFFTSSYLFPFAVYIKNIELVKSSLLLKDDKKRSHFFCSFTMLSKEINKLFKSVVRIDAGSYSLLNRVLFSSLSGTFSVQIKDAMQIQWPYEGVEGALDIKMEIPSLSKPTCFVSGVLDSKQGHFILKNVEELYAVDCLVQKNRQENIQENRGCEYGFSCKITAQFPFSHPCRLFINDNKNQLVEGICSLQVDSFLDKCGSFLGGQETVKKENNPMALKGKLNMQDVKVCSCLLSDSCTITVEKMGNSFLGTIAAVLADTEVEGAWNFDLESWTASLKLYNTKNIHFSSFYIDADDFTCSMVMQPAYSMDRIDGSINSAPDSDLEKEVVFVYHCLLHSTVAKESYDLQGQLTLKDVIKDGRFLLNGTMNTYTYSGAGSLYKTPYIECFECHDNSRDISCDGSCVSLISIKGTGSDRWSSIISHSIVFSVLHFFTGLELQGKGDIVLDIFSFSRGVECAMRFDDGVIRLPHTYNFITNFGGNVRWLFGQREFCFSDMRVLLNAGFLESKKGIVKMDSGGKLLFIHMPFLFDRCLFNLQKNIFAMVSGSWLLSKKLSEPTSIDGSLFIDSAQMNSALFSFKFSDILSDQISLTTKSFYHDVIKNIALNMAIETKSFIGIDTPLLKAHAAVDLSVTGTIANPLLYGAITFDSGSIMLPYKPLHITKGGVFFDAENTFNPSIELQAKNRIKKYMVTLYAHGLLDNHQIMFDSNPPLTEEQIIALLLVGSPEESLNTMMPAFLMNNLQLALFGQGSESFLDKYLKRSALPFTISLVPSFTDQTGRGGLRGGIEITLNDSWRALIQKNFSLSEDTRFELEYFFSDDIGLRAIRDEHRDIGVEVEMRWKF